MAILFANAERLSPLREGNREGRAYSVPPASRGNLKEGAIHATLDAHWYHISGAPPSPPEYCSKNLRPISIISRCWSGERVCQYSNDRRMPSKII
jgi:hypothetical protein